MVMEEEKKCSFCNARLVLLQNLEAGFCHL